MSHIRRRYQTDVTNLNVDNNENFLYGIGIHRHVTLGYCVIKMG